MTAERIQLWADFVSDLPRHTAKSAVLLHHQTVERKRLLQGIVKIKVLGANGGMIPMVASVGKNTFR
jgi:hypothetical protein